MDKSLLILHGQEVGESSSRIKMTKLWENPSPTSSFSGDIDLSSADYDMLLWVLDGANWGRNCVSVIVHKGKTVTPTYSVYAAGAIHVYSRSFVYSSATKYTSTSGSDNGTTDNSKIIPCVIYGIKL